MASRSAASMPASRRHQPAACSGSSHVENGTGDLPCLRRLNRSSSAAATTRPSTTSAAAGSWKTALIPSTRMSASVAPAAGSQTSRLSIGLAEPIHPVLARRRTGRTPACSTISR